MAFGQLLDEKYFSLMVLFSQLPIYCIISVSPRCPSTCLKFILDFRITFEAALHPLESTPPTTVFQSSSFTLFQVTIIWELSVLCPQSGNVLTRMLAFYLNRTISFFICDSPYLCYYAVRSVQPSFIDCGALMGIYNAPWLQRALCFSLCCLSGWLHII